jgi:hypothetical protein
MNALSEATYVRMSQYTRAKHLSWRKELRAVTRLSATVTTEAIKPGSRMSAMGGKRTYGRSARGLDRNIFRGLVAGVGGEAKPCN